MTEKIAKVLSHSMHKHIHDDRLACSKCEANGYLKGLKKADILKNGLIRCQDEIRQVLEQYEASK